MDYNINHRCMQWRGVQFGMVECNLGHCRHGVQHGKGRVMV